MATDYNQIYDQALNDVHDTMNYGLEQYGLPAGQKPQQLAMEDFTHERLINPSNEPMESMGGGGGNVIPLGQARRMGARPTALVRPKSVESTIVQSKMANRASQAAGQGNKVTVMPPSMFKQWMINNAMKNTGHYAAGGAVAASAPAQANPKDEGMVKVATVAAAKHLGGPKLAFGVMQRYRKQYDAGRAFALAALKGTPQKPSDLGAACDAITKASHNVLDGQDVTFEPGDNGVIVNVQSHTGKQEPQQFALTIPQFMQFLQGNAGQYDHLMQLGLAQTVQKLQSSPDQSAAPQAPQQPGMAAPAPAAPAQPGMAKGGPVLHFQDAGAVPDENAPAPTEDYGQLSPLGQAITSSDWWTGKKAEKAMIAHQQDQQNNNLGAKLLHYLSGTDAVDAKTEASIRKAAGLPQDKSTQGEENTPEHPGSFAAQGAPVAAGPSQATPMTNAPNAASMRQGITQDVTAGNLTPQTTGNVQTVEHDKLLEMGFTPEEAAMYHAQFGYGIKQGGNQLEWLAGMHNTKAKAEGTATAAQVRAAASLHSDAVKQAIANDKISQLDRATRSRLVAAIQSARIKAYGALKAAQINAASRTIDANIVAGHDMDLNKVLGPDVMNLLKVQIAEPGMDYYGGYQPVNPTAQTPTMPSTSGGPPAGWAPPGYKVGPDGKTLVPK